jgi:hypothetical protein
LIQEETEMNLTSFFISGSQKSKKTKNESQKKEKVRASGKKRFISINKPDKNIKHKVANTGAVERYVFISCIVRKFSFSRMIDISYGQLHP